MLLASAECRAVDASVGLLIAPGPARFALALACGGGPWVRVA